MQAHQSRGNQHSSLAAVHRADSAEAPGERPRTRVLMLCSATMRSISRNSLRPPVVLPTMLSTRSHESALCVCVCVCVQKAVAAAAAIETCARPGLQSSL